FRQDRYDALRGVQAQLVRVLAAYFRAPSFIARYLPLDDPALRDVWERGHRNPEAVERGREAIRHSIQGTRDRSGQTILDRVHQFLACAVELSERATSAPDQGGSEDEDEAIDPLQELLGAVAVYSRPRGRAQVDRDDVEEAADGDGTYRVVPLVRMVSGDT